jgi:hypothetical protein
MDLLKHKNCHVVQMSLSIVQGSILDPIIFTSFSNDKDSVLKTTLIFKYAKDSKVFFKSRIQWCLCCFSDRSEKCVRVVKQMGNGYKQRQMPSTTLWKRKQTANIQVWYSINSVSGRRKGSCCPNQMYWQGTRSLHWKLFSNSWLLDVLFPGITTILTNT